MNLDRIEAMLRLLQRQPHVGELQAEQTVGETWRIRARKWPGVRVPTGAEMEAADAPAPEPVRTLVTALRVGVFRAADRPLSLGDAVKAAVTVGYIDSMGIRNPVAAPDAGRLVEILVEDGDPVEYGQRLFVVAPDAPEGE